MVVYQRISDLSLNHKLYNQSYLHAPARQFTVTGRTVINEIKYYEIHNILCIGHAVNKIDVKHDGN